MNDFEIIEDEPLPYPEKPKRKGKPINWRQIGEYTIVGMSVLLGGFALICVVVFVVVFVNAVCSQLTLPIERMNDLGGLVSLVDAFKPVVTIGISIGIMTGLISYLAEKFK